MIYIANLRNFPMNTDYCVRIDRKTKWGNPYRMNNESERLSVIKKYTYYILDSRLLDNLVELEDKILCCHCYPLPCHGNVLKYLCEHPEVVGMYRGKTLSRDDIVRMIWKENEWKCESVGQQMTLF